MSFCFTVAEDPTSGYVEKFRRRKCSEGQNVVGGMGSEEEEEEEEK
jgi:hypothetical protein